jgi:hypothetical protein
MSGNNEQNWTNNRLINQQQTNNRKIETRTKIWEQGFILPTYAQYYNSVIYPYTYFGLFLAIFRGVVEI